MPPDSTWTAPFLLRSKAAERVWGSWAEGHGLDVVTFLPTVHGKRTEETIRGLNLAGVEAIRGGAAFLASLPAERWAIVTSAPRALAVARIAAAAMASVVVTVTHAHPLETDVMGVVDYAQLRAEGTAEGLLRVVTV